ncbi:MAG: ABC transporter permease subunit [Armatimonadetes bacterium]|nr:ABC transporter permease subunit [Armatimonadota bacterium]
MSNQHRIFQNALVAAVGMLFAAPMLYLLLLSFAEGWTFPHLFPPRVSAGLWETMWGREQGLVGGLLLSILLSVVVAVGSTSVGFLAARYVSYHRWRRGLLFLSYIPFVMSPVVLGACIHVVFIRLGLVGTVAGVVIAQLMFALGFAVIFFVSFWNAERKSLEEAARMLGATTPQTYSRVLLPISRQPLLLCFLQTFLFSWFQYGLTLIIGGGKITTLPVLVYLYTGEANIYYAAGASILLMLPPLVMLWGNRAMAVRFGR